MSIPLTERQVISLHVSGHTPGEIAKKTRLRPSYIAKVIRDNFRGDEDPGTDTEPDAEETEGMRADLADRMGWTHS